MEPISNSTFHSLQLTGERRFSKGFSVLANYTWSRALTTARQIRATALRIPIRSTTRSKRGRPISIIRTCSPPPAVELPVRFGNKLVDSVIGGWNLTGIATLQRETPSLVEAASTTLGGLARTALTSWAILTSQGIAAGTTSSLSI